MREDVPAWPPGASRSTTIVRSPSDAPYTAAARPAGPPPMIIVSYSTSRALVCNPSSRATSRVLGLVATVPSASRSTGQSASPGGAPCHMSASCGASGVSQSKLIWLRARNRRSSVQAPSHFGPIMVARAFGGSAVMPCNPPSRSRASAPIRVEKSGEAAAIV